MLGGTPPQAEEHLENYVQNLRGKLMRKLHGSIRGFINISSDRVKARYDLKANSSGLQTSDKVWFYNPKTTKGAMRLGGKDCIHHYEETERCRLPNSEECVNEPED